jgi:hypothetical protein
MQQTAEQFGRPISGLRDPMHWSHAIFFGVSPFAIFT